MSEDTVDLDEAQQQVKEKRLLESMDRDGELAQFKELLALEPLRDLMWRILNRCHIYGSVYQKNFGDMAFAEGQRNIGLWLLNEICEADPTAEIAMKQKANRLAFQQKAKSKRRRATSP